MASPIETLALLGVRNLLCTGLALSVLADLLPGNLVAVTDHINFTGLNPLIGAPGGAKTMVNMNEAYDKRLLRRVKTAAAGSGVSVHEGVVMWFSGPSFETPSEAKVARQLGADLISWTIVPECILARRYGLPFVGPCGGDGFRRGLLQRKPQRRPDARPRGGRRRGDEAPDSRLREGALRRNAPIVFRGNGATSAEGRSAGGIDFPPAWIAVDHYGRAHGLHDPAVLIQCAAVIGHESAFGQ